MTDMQRQTLQQIEVKEEKVDEMLDELGKGIDVLMQQAEEIGHQVEIQDEILDDIEKNVKKGKDELKNVNEKMDK